MKTDVHFKGRDNNFPIFVSASFLVTVNMSCMNSAPCQLGSYVETEYKCPKFQSHQKRQFSHVVGPTVPQLYPFNHWELRDESGPVSVSVPSFKIQNPCEEVSHLRVLKFAAPRRNAATEEQIKMKTT